MRVEAFTRSCPNCTRGGNGSKPDIPPIAVCRSAGYGVNAKTRKKRKTMKEKEEKKTFKIAVTYPAQTVGWLETNLPNDVMTRLRSYIETAQKNPTSMNSNLAGNISKSLIIIDKDNWFFENILLPHVKQFVLSFPSFKEDISIFNENAPYCLNPFWVNFQKENEFNPPHKHSGVWSFVVWVKIPTDWREQHALPISANSNMPKASNFEFYCDTMLGNSEAQNFNLDKESEGKMLFFPAKLMHQVYPFYECDEERISISGNILFDISENTMKQFRSR